MYYCLRSGETCTTVYGVEKHVILLRSGETCTTVYRVEKHVILLRSGETCTLYGADKPEVLSTEWRNM